MLFFGIFSEGAQDRTDIIYPELEASLQVVLQDPEYKVPRQSTLPLIILDLPSLEIAQALCQRCVLLKELYNLWFQTTEGVDAMVEQLRLSYMDIDEAHRTNPSPFNLRVKGLGFKFPLPEKVALKEHLFEHLHFQGPHKVATDMKEIKHARNVFLFSTLSRDLVVVGDMMSPSNRKPVLAKYSLKTRVFLGPTSMDTELSFVMAHLAQVDKGKVVLDPFVGTGGLLVPCAHYGATCFGMEIDWNILHNNKAKGRARLPVCMSCLFGYE